MVLSSEWVLAVCRMTRELVGVTALHGSLHGAGAMGSSLPSLDDSHLLLAKQRLHYFAGKAAPEARVQGACWLLVAGASGQCMY